MRNVRENQLKTCIFMESEDFASVVREALGHDVNISFSLDGLDIYTDEESIDCDVFHKALASHFDVKEITSIHIDDCEIVGVWIVYKD